MNTPSKLTIKNGALAMDGGSVFLEAVDDLGQRRSILLDWSIAAQKEKRTSLRIDDRQLAKRSPEEDAWISVIAAAEVAPPVTARVEGEKISSKRLVLAKDAKAVLEAGERSPLDGICALRDSLLEKI